MVDFQARFRTFVNRMHEAAQAQFSVGFVFSITVPNAGRGGEGYIVKKFNVFIENLKSFVILVFRRTERKDKVMSDYILQTRNLTKSFGKCKAVNGISMRIEEGCIYGLLGPNGAGKSTFLKMITGMLRPTEGTIAFEGHPWRRKDLCQIGALIENPPVYENLTAAENLKVHTLALGIPEKRIGEVLETVDLTGTGKKRVGQFSYGMKQRLGIAAALLRSPRLLILDEPTNGLDPVGIQELRNLIRWFPEQGITVILSSHILGEVQQTADRIGIIAGGVLGYEGDISGEDDLEELFMNVVRENGRERR